MNTDKVLNLLPSVLFIGGVTYLAMSNLAASYLVDASMVVSYGAVAALLAMAAFDSTRSKTYAKR